MDGLPALSVLREIRQAYEEAYTYAKKAYIDGDDTLSTKAALTTALILCAIAELKQGKEKLGYYVKSVYLACEAVFSEYFHRYPKK